MPRVESEEISENEMPGIRNGIPERGTYNKYGDSGRRVEIEAIEKNGAFAGMPFSEIPGASLIEWET